MILLRQKIFADKDYAGLNMLQRGMKRIDRNWIAWRTKRGRSRANKVMNNSIEASNRSAIQDLNTLANSDFAKSKRERNLATKDILNQNQQNVNNAFAQRNQEYDRLLRKADRKDRRISRRYVKDVTPNYGVNKVTNTYRPAPTTTTPTTPTKTTTTTTTIIPQTQQKTGMGFGKKVAIGAGVTAGVAAAGYGAYRLIKAKKQKQQEEETENNNPQNNKQSIKY